MTFLARLVKIPVDLPGARVIAPVWVVLLGRVKLKPRDPDLLRALASIYVMVGQSRVAIARCDEVLAIAPGDVNAIDGKAVALDLAQRHGEAQAVYRRALTLAPEDPIISNNLALSLLMEGRT